MNIIIYEKYCIYNTEYIDFVIDNIQSIVESLEKCSKDVKERKMLYEWCDNSQGLIVSTPDVIRLDQGYLNPETEDVDELINDIEMFKDYCCYNIVLRLKSLILYLNHCLKWLTRVAKPAGWQYADDEIEELLDDRRTLIDIFYKLDPTEYLKFLQIEEEIKLFEHWDPLDGYKVPNRYIRIIPCLKDVKGIKNLVDLKALGNPKK